jgi:prepilin-type N-terminal cleavage/methylation domain-containing protein
MRILVAIPLQSLCDCNMASGFVLRFSDRDGVTLIELLTVVGIIGVVAAFVLRSGAGSARSAAVVRATGELAVIAASLESYRTAFGDYPRTSTPSVLLQSLIGKIGPTGNMVERRSHLDVGQFSTGAGWDPFSRPDAELIDPWGRSYRYAYKAPMPWTRLGYVLFSSGPDQSYAPLLSGGVTDESAAENQDNLTADR